MKSSNPNSEKNSLHKYKREGALAAMRRAAKVAHKRAAARGDKIAISQDGKVVWIDPIVDQ